MYVCMYVCMYTREFSHLLLHDINIADMSKLLRYTFCLLEVGAGNIEEVRARAREREREKKITSDVRERT